MNDAPTESRTRTLESLWLMLIIGAYLIMAFAYSIVNPAFESPDEIHHYAFVSYLTREHRLPVAELGGPQSEYHQPPLYYWLGTVATALGGLGADRAQDPYVVAQRNPFWAWRIGQVGSDNKNQFIHGPAEAFPYHGWPLSLHLVRWMSAAFQVLTILATYLIGREVFPDQPAIRLGALAFVAFVPQFLFVSASASNDNLIVPLTALVTLLLVRVLGRGLNWRRSVALGILIGLALLTKMSALVLLPLTLVTVTIAGCRDRAWRQMVWAWAAVLGLSALLSGPILIRNLESYGEPTALRRMSEIWGQHDPPLSYVQALREIPNVWTSFWARFGYGQIPLPNSCYVACLVFSGLALVGLVVWLLREHRRLAARTAWQLLLLAVVGGLYLFSVVSYIRVSLTGANGRFAFPALPAFAILFFLGLSGWVPRRWNLRLAAIANTGMLTFAVVALVGYLRPAYAPPRLLRELPVPQHAVALQFGGMMALRGYALDREVAYPGDDVTVTLYWEGLAAPKNDYAAFIHLLGPNGELVGARDTYPGLGRFPTSQWRTGDAFVDAVTVPVQPEAEVLAPVALRLEVGFYDLVTGERLPIVDARGQVVDFPVVGRVKLASHQPAKAHPVTADHRNFGNQISLLGYDLPASAEPGQALPFTLYWQTVRRPDRDYSVFVHLLDSTDVIVAQGDGPPLGSAYPTSLWDISDELADKRQVQLPSNLTPGTYRLRIGFYDPATGQRIPALDEGGNEVGDSITLPPIHVGREDAGDEAH